MCHIFVTNSQKTACPLQPSALLNQGWRLFSLLLLSIHFLHCIATFSCILWMSYSISACILAFFIFFNWLALEWMYLNVFLWGVCHFVSRLLNCLVTEMCFINTHALPCDLCKNCYLIVILPGLVGYCVSFLCSKPHNLSFCFLTLLQPLKCLRRNHYLKAKDHIL